MTSARQFRPAIPAPEVLATLPRDGGAGWNRLVFEQSPYLLQHAANPVDWFPWGTEAFERARREDKPVFLSVGYATCHWCHVMEHESFEDDAIASLMNEAFVCIKVDREERPDIDHVYMTVTQALTGSGGWPMTVVMTPDKEPFFAGTYFPKRGGYGRPGMTELIPALSNAWKSDRENILRSAAHITEVLAQMSGGSPGGEPGADILDAAFQQFEESFDPAHGGFGSRPKFPVPHNLSFLLRYWYRTGEGRALEMVKHTLRAMRMGGVFDQIGFGFHRYSTDNEWLVPHFEKMLYDQALMAIACIETCRATGEEEFAQTTREIFTYILRDMTSPEGGFYCAEDADSEGIEGKFYLWTPDEVRRVLGKEEGELFCRTYQIVNGGNFRDEATGRKPGESIPHLRAATGTQDPALLARLEAAREKLFTERESRIHPLKDDKTLTDWNGLMIAALAKGAKALGSQEYLHAAARAADFVLGSLRREDGRLLKRYRQGHAGLPAHLEDYAVLAWGLLELYEAGFDPRHLRAAIELTDTMLEHFLDAGSGGLFLTADDGEKLLTRSKDIH
ncbi:thioredoxin domain-containing protein, partial [Candidatus Poribacteria bacterium]|nr:thioredoxin domain-containing protein [Candidatus Poribacteria bacterium]